MIVSVASGKGGTGKTTVAVNLALSLEDSLPVQFLDCDVEAPNAHLFLKPNINQTQPVLLPVPEVIEQKCTYCGKCAEICAYNALAVLETTVLTFHGLCHGCGGCSLLCPEKAIFEKGLRIGKIDTGTVSTIQFIQGILDVGNALSPPIIRAVKKHINSSRTVIIDVPPGTSCPMVESVKGSDFCLLVTEPTPFGLNDLRLAWETLKKLNIPAGVIINRAGIGDDKVEDYCFKEKIPVLMTIPMDKKIATAYSEGISIIENQSSYKRKFIQLYEKMRNL